jgi:F-type H+-transporting ATPase subunit delta
MVDYQAGKRYAQAAFEIAREQGTIARWRAELDDVATVLAESDAAPMFANARVPLERRLALIDRALDVSPLAGNLAKLLVTKGRSGDARAVAEAFGRLADAHEGIVNASVTTAIPLDPEQQRAIDARLAASLAAQVRSTHAVDPAIIGGVILRVGDRMIDGSVRTRLRQLRRQLEGAG